MIENLKKGDRIITSGGVHGRITNVDENVLTVEIADQVKVKLNRGNVATTLQTAPPAAEKPGKAETGK
jgi:preprotein translocase subunit YajC